ncbi:unnamed protein product [Schistosoma turkestanicum]|nr:unnamed protein product [Schistosoma turkestanicum]
MSNDTRRDLLLGIDSMLTNLLNAIRFERKIYDDSFHDVENSPKTSNLNKKEKNFSPSATSCKATQTVQTFPLPSDLYNSPIDLRLNQDVISQQKCHVSKYTTPSGFTSSGHQSCCLSIAHHCEKTNHNGFTLMYPSHSNSSCSCSCKLHQDKYCSTPKCNNIDLSRTGNITAHSNHILSSDAKNSSTSGCSTACSSCQKHSCGFVTPKYPSESFPTKSDCSCSCRMHILTRLS